MATGPIRDVSNPACVGFEFTNTYDDFPPVTWQFVFYPNVVAFGIKSGDRAWTHSTITAPERFGPLPAGQSPTRAERKIARAWVDAFVAASESTEVDA